MARFTSALCILSFIGSSAPAVGVAGVVDAATVLPDGALGFVEITDANRLVEQVASAEATKLILNTPQFEAAQQDTGYQRARAGALIAQTYLGTDLLTAASKLLHGRVSVAIYPQVGESNPNVVVVVQVEDQMFFEGLYARMQPLLVLAGDQVKDVDPIADIRVLSYQDQAFAAWGPQWVAISNHQTLLKTTIEGLTGSPNEKTLSQDGPYQAMVAQMGSDHFARGYVNTQMLTAAVGRWVPEKVDNPLASLLASGISEILAKTPFVGLTIDSDEDHMAITAGIAGAASELGDVYQSFFSPADSPGTQPLPAIPGLIGGFTIYRNAADWYRNRESLLEEASLPGFDLFEAGLGNILPGRDFGTDVLPTIGSRFTFVAAPQDYSHLDGKPGIQLPGFGLVVELAKPEEGESLFQLFFQTLTAILNLQAGQQGRQPWLMTSEAYEGVQIAYGRYLQKPSGERLPLVFNFMPAAARIGDQYIITSSLSVCRQLVDSLKDPKPVAVAENRNANLEFHFESLASILEDNRRFFEARRIQQGITADEAGAEWNTILALVRCAKSLQLTTSVKPNGFQMRLEGRWK